MSSSQDMAKDLASGGDVDVDDTLPDVGMSRRGCGVCFSLHERKRSGKLMQYGCVARKGDTMPSPFPGMDPYLESPVIWPDVHHELISEIQAALNPHLRPRYVARVELRVYISDDDDPGRQALVPDVGVENGPTREACERRLT